MSEGQTHVAQNFLIDRGEMGAFIRSKNWSQTPLGPIESWPQSLRTTVDICLASDLPICIIWGSSLTQLYNDGYRVICGDKHPRSMGQNFPECWREAWPVIGAAHDSALGGNTAFLEDQHIFLERHGYIDECFFTFSFSPVRDEVGRVGGLFHPVIEMTAKMLGERRTRTLRDVSARTTKAETVEGACALAVQALADYELDLPFALIYLFDESGKSGRLVAATGLPAGTPASPERVETEPPASSAWPLGDVFRTGQAVVVEDVEKRFGRLVCRPYPEAPRAAVALPLTLPGAHRPTGVLIAGVSARLKLNPAYRDFYEMLTAAVATAAATGRAFEEERKRAEALAELDQAKTAFFSNVSHEFRTPLTLMLGPVEDALAEPMEPPQKERMEMLHRNALRLHKLVNTLLDFSRIEAGRIQASYEPTDLTSFTAELASVFRSAVEKAGMRLIVECEPLSGPAYVDRDMWEKVVLNLVSNAFKFTLEGEVEVSVREADGNAVLRVRDTGSGISEEQLPHIFERFHRVEGARARAQEGTGIGLALVQELVKLHGGTVDVGSIFGEGTTFTVTLPLGKEHLPEERIGGTRTVASTALGASHYVEEALRWLPGGAGENIPTNDGIIPDASGLQTPATPRSSDAARPRILLADDNADMRDYLTRLLSADYEVAAVADGRTALETIRRDPPDLVLTDVMMPGLDGFELLQRLRSLPATQSIPVIMLSARAGEESRVEGLEAGADDYLVKPFSARELFARVASQLKLSSVRAEGSRRELELQAEAHESTKQRTAQYETLLNEAPLGVYLVDADLRIREVNPTARPVFGDLPDLIGRDFDEVIHVLWPQAYADELVHLFRHTLETGEPYFAPERVEDRLDRGLPEFYEWQINRIPLPGGRFGVVCYFRDISAQVFTREALKDADRRKDEFLAMLAHELRNPLAAIANAAQVAKRIDAVEHREWGHAVIEAQVKNLSRMIDDLLDVSRITRGKIELKKQHLKLTTIIRSALEASRPLIEERKHRLIVDLAPEPLAVRGDPTRIEQVVVNLLNNAAKYTESNGRITVAARADGPNALISVEDTGVGMTPELLSKVFELFTQGDRTIARSEGGLGIGLTLVKSLVEMHGGTVTAESDGPGKGSRLTVRLPLASEQVLEPNKPGEPAAVSAKAGQRVLVVDDNLDTARGMVRLLKLLGNDVRVAHDGPSALEEARSHRPDIILLDIGLPGMDGYRVARMLRDEGFDRTVIIAVSGYGEELARARSRESGFNHHLVKPVDFDSLVALISRPH